jgi:hypothetical protein
MAIADGFQAAFQCGRRLVLQTHKSQPLRFHSGLLVGQRGNLQFEAAQAGLNVLFLLGQPTLFYRKGGHKTIEFVGLTIAFSLKFFQLLLLGYRSFPCKKNSV